jgi:hypothetical protein
MHASGSFNGTLAWRGLSWTFAIALFLQPMAASADGVTSAVYVRTDSDSTLVVSPRAHVAKQLSERDSVDVTYAADIWTSASIDIRASASKAVTEQRNELDLGVAHAFDDLKLNASYRYSSENDYESHGVSAGAVLDLADKSSTLSLNAYLFQDAVGRAGDPRFSRSLGTLGGRLSFTQLFDPDTFAQLTYELAHLDGYQASPYRMVGVGGSGFGCVGALQCLPEHTPGLRTRHAFALLLRRALGASWSAGANYRFILDDWGIRSHTLALQIGLLATADTLLMLRYRFYTQSGADFYQAIYATLPAPSSFTTRDREQSPMHDHRIGLDVEQRVALADGRKALVISGGVGHSAYAYDNFVGLTNVSAWEVTVAMTLER